MTFYKRNEISLKKENLIKTKNGTEIQETQKAGQQCPRLGACLALSHIRAGLGLAWRCHTLQHGQEMRRKKGSLGLGYREAITRETQ